MEHSQVRKCDSMSEEEIRCERLQIFKRRIPFILEHCELSVRIKGERRGVLEMRRHIGGYIRGFDGAKELRMRLMTFENLSEVTEALQNL